MPKLAQSGIRGVIIRDIWKKRDTRDGTRYWSIIPHAASDAGTTK
jgi:hypothetical protein